MLEMLKPCTIDTYKDFCTKQLSNSIADSPKMSAFYAQSPIANASRRVTARSANPTRFRPHTSQKLATNDAILFEAYDRRALHKAILTASIALGISVSDETIVEFLNCFVDYSKNAFMLLSFRVLNNELVLLAFPDDEKIYKKADKQLKNDAFTVKKAVYLNLHLDEVIHNDVKCAVNYHSIRYFV